jgi:hypothetical protein
MVIGNRYPVAAFFSLRRSATQIAIELGMTADQVYDAAKGCQSLERGSDGREVWFMAKSPNPN